MKRVAAYLYPQMTQLDVLGPQQFLGLVPDWEVVTVAKTKAPLVTDTGIRILPDYDLADCPAVDILLVGGAADTTVVMRDPDVMAWFAKTGAAAEYVTSVCTGALILAEAGLLDGYKATTHWAYLKELGTYPIEVSSDRVVRDRNRITAGGVTAGIDFALTLIADLVSPELAAALQLMTQYDPEPPTPYGVPEKAPAELVAEVKAQLAEMCAPVDQFFAEKARRDSAGAWTHG
jgi:transcriptional regulator GlxA family with amidase domain